MLLILEVFLVEFALRFFEGKIMLLGLSNPKIYAISTQKENFHKVSPKNVLGIFEVTERDNLYALEYLEVKPTHTYGNK